MCVYIHTHTHIRYIYIYIHTYIHTYITETSYIHTSPRPHTYIHHRDLYTSPRSLIHAHTHTEPHLHFARKGSFVYPIVATALTANTNKYFFKKNTIWKKMLFENTMGNKYYGKKQPMEKTTPWTKKNLPRRRAPCPRLHRAPLLLAEIQKKKCESQCLGIFTVKRHCREHFWEFAPIKTSTARSHPGYPEEHIRDSLGTH